jgi:hypothetical protein
VNGELKSHGRDQYSYFDAKSRVFIEPCGGREEEKRAAEQHDDEAGDGPREELARDAGERRARRAETEEGEVKKKGGAAEEGESNEMDDLGDADAGYGVTDGGVEGGAFEPLN